VSVLGAFGGTAAGERTDLAWTRTALGFWINAALVARFASQLPASAAGYAIAGLMGVAGVALWFYGGRPGSSRARAVREGDVTARPRALRAVWGATVATTIFALVLAVWLLVR
jgi:uncharacterized membrane protein YidH (DUF202 family)